MCQVWVFGGAGILTGISAAMLSARINSGQPNLGKSTLFNLLTGLNQHVGNWPGKTVERREGTLARGAAFAFRHD